MAAPVLVVDDDPKIVSLVKTYLEREGFRVITAADGAGALRAFNEFDPGLIVLDVMLPEIDGLALMRIVRERSRVPIVMLSARGSTADAWTVFPPAAGAAGTDVPDDAPRRSARSSVMAMLVRSEVPSSPLVGSQGRFPPGCQPGS